MKYRINISIKNLNETKFFAKVISKIIHLKVLILLKGKIGTGKTTFTSYLINEIAKKKTKVLSPTFPIVNTYKFEDKEIWHYDLYRLNDKKEFNSLDFEIALENYVIVEWPEIMEDLFPHRRIEISFKDLGDYSRNIDIIFFGYDNLFYNKVWKLLKQKF